MVELNATGFHPSSPPPSELDVAAKDVFAVADHSVIRWCWRTVQEAKAWQGKHNLDPVLTPKAKKAVEIISRSAELERTLFSSLAPPGEDITSLVGVVAADALFIGLALHDLLGDTKAAELQAELIRHKRGLSKGNLERTARKNRWQSQARRWCEEPKRDWSLSNAALATAFRKDQPNTLAPHSADLARFIGGLRPKPI